MIIKTYNPLTLAEQETITELTSVIFSKRFYRSGSFEIETTSKNFKVGDIIVFKAYGEINSGIVLKIQEDFEKISVSGFDLSGVLGFRYFNIPKDYSGTADKIIKDIISDYFTSGDRALPNLQIEAPSETGETVSLSPEADFLNNIIENFCLLNEIGFSFDFDLQNIIFKTKKGVDKSNYLKFSRKNKTVSSTSFLQDLTNSYNVGYSIDDQQQPTETGSGIGFLRRECFSEKNINECMANKKAVETLSAEASEKYKYKIDYDLGDYVTIENNGIYQIKQITEIKEVFEKNRTIVVPTFGNEKENPLKKIIESEGIKR